MKLRPRHYLLLAVLLLLAAFNIFRLRSKRLNPHAATGFAPMSTASQAPGTSPLWAVYDKAAGDALNAAPGAQFQADLQSLNAALDGAAPIPQTSVAQIDDLTGCRTWLQFYRSERVHPTNKPEWLPQTRGHVNSCMQNHRDISS